MTSDFSGAVALVTGATGFVGSHAAALLASRGAKVSALVRATSDRRTRAAFEGEPRRGDLSDPASLEAALSGVDFVFHFAGATRARNEASFMETNAAGVARLVEAARKAAPDLKRFVYVSSLAAAGPSGFGPPIRESDPPRPVSAYGRSKLEGERRLSDGAGPIPWTIVRPPIVYGPEDRDVLELFKAARRGFTPMVGTGDEPYSVVYVEDLVRGILDAALSPRAVGRTYFVAEETTYRQREMLAHIAAAVGKKPRVFAAPRILARLLAAGGSAMKPFLKRPPLLTLDKLPEVLAGGWTCSVEAAAADFGFRAEVPLPEGARRTAAWLREDEAKARSARA
jgi:nucleoside-diphosphate-sugar epimerase